MRRGLKSILLFFLLALLMVSVSALPAMAADPMNISVNGDRVAFGTMYQENGVSAVSAADFARFSGAKLVQGKDGTCTFTENGTTLVYTPGTQEAILNGKPIALPMAPVQNGNDLMIPLRFTADNFGYQIAWDEEKELASLTRQEIKDGMTPVQLLSKSAQAAQAVNTYQISGDLDIATNISIDGKPAPVGSIQMNSKITGSVNSKPLAMYMTQELTPTGGAAGLKMETYMTADKIYINQGGQGWMVMPSIISPDFIKQQQEIQSDPLKEAAQIEKMGVLLNYSDDITVDGNDYYVINATADPDKFMQYYQDMMQKFMSGVSLPGAGGTPGGSAPNIQDVMKKTLQNSKLDFHYTIYVNKKTLLSDTMNMGGNMQININTADFPKPANTNPDAGGETPKNIQTILTMQGSFKIQNPGSPFAPPDISGAKPFSLPGTPGSSGKVTDNTSTAPAPVTK